MAREGTRKPAITWGQFLDTAPYFTEPMWRVDDCLSRDWAPLVRAVAYFDVFRGQVENGGVSQYLFNKASSLLDFAVAPAIVRRHPLLEEVAGMMMVHGDTDMVRHYIEAHQHATETAEWANECWIMGRLAT